MLTQSEILSPTSCRIDIDIFHRRGVNEDKSSWFDLWAAGVAVQEKCIKQGKLGTAINLGESYHSLDERESSAQIRMQLTYSRLSRGNITSSYESVEDFAQHLT